VRKDESPARISVPTVELRSEMRKKLSSLSRDESPSVC
jgi:hypothetical protein